MRTRLLSALIATAAIASAAPRPADAAPSRLWYKVDASYHWKGELDTVYLDGRRTKHLTIDFEWRLKTPTDTPTDEAPLIRRGRNGKASFGEALTAYAEGTLTKSTVTSTETLVEPPGPYAYNCNPQKFTHTQTLTGRPRLEGELRLDDEGFSAHLLPPASEPMARGVDITGPTTCQRCPRPHPSRPTEPVLFDDGSCTYPPLMPYEAGAPYVGKYLHGGIVGDFIRDTHTLNARGRFGGKRMSISSTATGSFASEHGRISGDPYDLTETVTETITIKFSRCPRGGRRPC
jgi:hypothetical protein